MSARRVELLRAALVALGVLGVLVGSSGCSRSPSEAAPDPAARKAEPAAQASAASGEGVGPLLADDQLRLVKAPPGEDVVELVRAERARQAALGRSVIVYAGAKWCEPCQHFHEAASAGRLDKAFPKLTIMEFDVDADGDRLKRAGYHSRFIPLFVVPDADGRPTDRRLEGSVKGNGAVDEIVPRLRKILGTS